QRPSATRWRISSNISGSISSIHAYIAAELAVKINPSVSGIRSSAARNVARISWNPSCHGHSQTGSIWALPMRWRTGRIAPGFGSDVADTVVIFDSLFALEPDGHHHGIVRSAPDSCQVATWATTPGGRDPSRRCSSSSPLATLRGKVPVRGRVGQRWVSGEIQQPAPVDAKGAGHSQAILNGWLLLAVQPAPDDVDRRTYCEGETSRAHLRVMQALPHKLGPPLRL